MIRETCEVTGIGHEDIQKETFDVVDHLFNVYKQRNNNEHEITRHQHCQCHVVKLVLVICVVDVNEMNCDDTADDYEVKVHTE